jgi:hypothetical protein
VSRTKLWSAALAAVAAAAIAPAGASAATTAPSRTTYAQAMGQQGRVTVAVKVNRFASTAAGPRAVATATATLRGLGGMPTTAKQKVRLAVAKKGSCNILTLTLDTLDLKLLGLNVHLDKVDLRVTGRKKGGVLGRLFCSLAGAKVKTASAAAARLNMKLRHSPMRPFRVTVPVQAVAAQSAGVCQVLELVLGPLNVDLLGLVVDLKKVHLLITATPGGGVLGNLFCGLANGSTTG